MALVCNNSMRVSDITKLFFLLICFSRLLLHGKLRGYLVLPTFFVFFFGFILSNK